MPSKGLTVREAAEAMNVSVRCVYDAGKLLRSGRQDLIAAVEAGTLSLNAALVQAGLRTPKTPLQRAQAAYRSLSERERNEFVVWLAANLQE